MSRAQARYYLFMSLTPKEIEHLASLARLQLTKEEIAEFASQLGGVLDYITKLQALSGKATINSQTEEANWRVDEVQEWSEPKALLSSSAAVQNNMIVVPEVFTDKE